MGGEKLVAIKEKFTQGIKLTQERKDNYIKGFKDLQDSLQNVFIKNPQAKDFTETNAPNQKPFDWHSIKPGMEALFDMDKIALTRKEIAKEGEAENGIEVLDRHIEKSGLYIRLDREKLEYIFEPPQSYTPKGQLFMQQFANLLTIYRFYFKISTIYLKLLEDSQIVEYKEEKAITEGISNLEADIAAQKNPRGFDFLLERKGQIQQEVYDFMDTINEQEQPFVISVPGKKEVLLNTFQQCIDKIEFFYKQYPSESWLGRLSEWQDLLQTVCTSLFSAQFSYGTRWSTIMVNKEFIPSIDKEFAQFIDAVEKERREYHVIYCNNALDSLHEIDKKIHTQSVYANYKLNNARSYRPDYFKPILGLQFFGSASESEDSEEETDELEGPIN